MKGTINQINFYLRNELVLHLAKSFTSFFFFEKQILMVCSLFLLSLTSQAFTGFPDILTLCIKAFSSSDWQSTRGILPWCQLKKHLSNFLLIDYK